MRCVFLTILLFISSIAFSQEKMIEGHVYDITSQTLVDYVYLLDEDSKIISLTDKNGYFKFDKSQTSANKIKFHKYGYQDTIVDINSEFDTLILRPQAFELDEVIVNDDVNKRYKYLMYYFKTYEYKNDIKRRYLDGILQVEHDTKKNKVDYEIIEYRSFANDSMIENEKGGIVSIQHEGTGYPAYKLMSIFELTKKYGDYKLNKIQPNAYQVSNKVGREIGRINLAPNGKEISATLTHNNEFGKVNKKLRASAKVLFKVEEEKYLKEDDYNTLEYRAISKKSLFKKGREDDFSVYETHSKLFLIDYKYEIPFYEDSVKLKKNQSNFYSEFWNLPDIEKFVNKSLYNHLKLNENKN